MHNMCRFFLLVLSSAVWLGAQPANTLTPKEVTEGWILLFDGESLFGWAPEGGAKWSVAGGAIVSDGGESGWLRSGSAFADFVLRCEFRTGADGNSGIFLNSASQGPPHETGYELQIFNRHEKFPTGSLVNHVRAKKTAFKPGEWNRYEVRVEGDRFVVSLNGKKVLDARQNKSGIGHVGLQYNKDRKIEFQNIKLLPLGLKPLFNGKDLAGWRKVDPPRPPKTPPEWSVREAMIHVEKGPGQLETEGTWDDFILQLDIRANAQNEKHHPNSGVFLRGDPNGYWTGYESQIRNEYKEGDRAAPVDFGTGGVYHYQPARKVVSNDNEFFTKTIVARGRHLGIWVNGFPVSDWEDPHPEGNLVRAKQAKLTPGAISLQAHDPTTNLDFRNLRLAALPK